MPRLATSDPAASAPASAHSASAPPLLTSSANIPATSLLAATIPPDSGLPTHSRTLSRKTRKHAFPAVDAADLAARLERVVLQRARHAELFRAATDPEAGAEAQARREAALAVSTAGPSTETGAATSLRTTLRPPLSRSGAIDIPPPTRLAVAVFVSPTPGAPAAAPVRMDVNTALRLYGTGSAAWAGMRGALAAADAKVARLEREVVALRRELAEARGTSGTGLT